MAYTKTCKICGKEFESDSRNTRYCSEKCSKRGAKKAYRSRKMKAINRATYASDKEINQLVQRVYKLSREIAEMFLPKECSCDDPNHICEGPLEVHHIDHCPMNLQVSNLRWLCKKAHAQLHSQEEDCDFIGELKAYRTIKEQKEIRDRNKIKQESETVSGKSITTSIKKRGSKVEE